MQANLSNPAFHSDTTHYPLLLDAQLGDRPTDRNLVPAVPSLLATRLQLQLLLCERSVDLRAASGIILNDVGATVEIFRRAGQECAGHDGHGDAPSVALRLEDCLAALGTEAWMDAVCAHAVERVAANGAQLSRLLAFWEHSRVLAYACSVVAEHTEEVCPEEAYLVGLLHEAAQLPELLGWNPRAHGGLFRVGPQEPVFSTQSGTLAGIQGGIQGGSALGAHWYLPLYLQAVVAGASAMPAHWRNLLRTAHAWSRGEQCFLSHTA